MNNLVKLMIGGLLMGVLYEFALSDDAPTAPALDICATSNSSCGECIAHADCVWCKDRCQKYYKSGSVFPAGCALTDARWMNCQVNFQILLITMGVLAGVIVISCLCCFYCCCCKTNQSKLRARLQRDEERTSRERAERQAKSTEKKADRQAKYDDIRRKYGLGGGASPQYAKFDNETDA